MKFVKMHGLGNDYILIDVTHEHLDSPPALAQAVSDRHLGVGGDGLILFSPSSSADICMEIYNADGSRAQMCGNGIRCLAKYVVDHGLVNGPEVLIETDAGNRLTQCHMIDGTVLTVKVDMGAPVTDAAALPSTIEGGRMVDHPLDITGVAYRVTGVSMGNPHAVIFVDDLDAVDLASVGPQIEQAPEFPERVNAHFVRVDAPAHVTMKTWERGSGLTQACGTGACAVGVAGVLTGRTDRGITATLPGGDLQIEWAANDHVYLTGPAVEVFTGDWLVKPHRLPAST